MIGNTNKNGTGTAYWLLQTAAGIIRTYGWEPELQSDILINDSDKTFTVAVGEEWIIKSIWVEFTSGAGAVRQLEVQIQDNAATVIGQMRAGVTVAAASTQYFLFAPHVPDLVALRDADYTSTPIPEWVLPAGYVVRVWDNAAVLPAADDMLVEMLIGKRPTT